MIVRAFWLAGMAALALVGCQASGDLHSPPPQESAHSMATTASAEELQAAAVQEEAASARSAIIASPAPDFTLPDQDGKPLTLSQLKGQWVVLYFYPKDDTPGCTCEATEFTALMGQFRNLAAKVYGISADSTATHRIFIDKYNFDLSLLSDRDQKVMRSYGAYVDANIGEKTYGRVIRSTVIVDPQGVIRWHWPEVIPKGHADRVRQRLQILQAAAKNQ